MAKVPWQELYYEELFRFQHELPPDLTFPSDSTLRTVHTREELRH